MKRALDLEVNSEFEDSTIVETDANILTQILLNLVGNAVKYTEEGKVRVDLRSSSNSNSIELLVSDTGIGIDQNQIPRLFDRFYQVGQTNSTGYGLGLSITKQLCDVLNSQISIESERAKGTHVRVELPLDYSKTSTQFTDEKLSQFQFQMHVLLVEDNRMNQSYMLELLKEWRMDCTLVDSIHEAKKAVSLNAYDLILLDMQLPDGSGLELAQYVKDQDIPSKIIAVTATVWNDSFEQKYSQYLDGYVSKPFVPDELMSEVKKLVPNTQNNQTGSISRDDQDFMILMKRTFIDECPSIIENIEKALVSSNLKQALDELHKLPNMLHLVEQVDFEQEVRIIEEKLITNNTLDIRMLTELIERLRAIIFELKNSLSDD